MNVLPTDRIVISVPEAAAILGISTNAAYLAAAAGQIPAVRVTKRRIAVPVAQLERLLAGDFQQAEADNA